MDFINYTPFLFGKIDLATALFLGYLFAQAGDYVFQNHYLATKKTQNTPIAALHALIYSLLFLLLVELEYWLIISITHFFIDRFRLAVYWIKFVNRNWQSKNYGYSEETPTWLSVSLMIKIDNVFHELINAFAICLQYEFFSFFGMQ